jgi:hypothetical protein
MADDGDSTIAIPNDTCYVRREWRSQRRNRVPPLQGQRHDRRVVAGRLLADGRVNRRVERVE